MSKEEFEKWYCYRSGITVEDYHNKLNQITLPCKCEYEGCEGWAAVTNEPIFIELHNQTYNSQKKTHCILKRGSSGSCD